MIENGEKPRGVNAYQPVGLAAAERRRIEIVVCAAVFERFEALADRRIFHRRDPQALHGLVAFVEQIDRAEDGFALAPGIAGIDDLAHVLPVHERVEQGKLLGFVSGNGILPALRQDGQIVVAPFGVLFIVGSGFGQFGQVPKTPGHDIAAAYKIAVLALIGTKNGGDGFSNRGLFRNYQLIHVLHTQSSPFSLLCASRKHRNLHQWPQESASHFPVPSGGSRRWPYTSDTRRNSRA